MIEILETGKLEKCKIKCCHCNSILQFTTLDEIVDTNLNLQMVYQLIGV